MVDYSSGARREISKVSGDNLPLTLLEIDHADLTSPVRVVNDRAGITFETNAYVAIAFGITLPSDLQSGLPRASLAIDNVGKELVEWLESSNGGQGTTIRIVQILRSDPTTIEFDITMILSNISINATLVTGDLGFDDLMHIPAVALSYTPDVAPGLYK